MDRAKWKRRGRTWLRRAVIAFLVTLPLGFAEDWIHSILRGWIEGRWGMLVRGVLAVVNHPWFPWALVPLAVLALMLKELLADEPTPVSPHASVLRDSAKSKEIGGQLVGFYGIGKDTRTRILADSTEWSDAWVREINGWWQSAISYVHSEISPAKAQWMNAIGSLRDVHIFHNGRPVPRRKGNLIQNLDAMLEKLAELMNQYG